MNMRNKLLRIERSMAGLCERCGRPAVEGLGHCQRCREQLNASGARQRTKRRGGPPTRLFWCYRCGQLAGHYSKTCQQGRRWGS